jgi:hypothetical protein
MTRLSRQECIEQDGHCFEPLGAVLMCCKHCGIASITIPCGQPAGQDAAA